MATTYKMNRVCETCGIKICDQNKNGKKCRSCRLVGNKNTLGRVMSSKQKKELCVTRIGDANPNWKGTSVGLSGLHSWVKRHLGKPKRCSGCHQVKKLDLANISQKYKRDFTDWEWLCRKCHMTKDGRLTRRKDGKFLCPSE
jgi:hypothetical protein